MPIKALAILLFACSALAQPAGTPPASSPVPAPTESQTQPSSAQPSSAQPSSAQDAETLRKRLTQTLEFAKQIVEKNEAAIAQLDEGHDPRQVMHELRSSDLRKAINNTRRARPQPQAANANAHQHPSKPNISKRDLKRVRNFIKEHLPKVHSQLQMIEEMSPNSTEKLLVRLAPKVIEILRLHETSPILSGLKLDELKAGLNYVDASSKYRAMVNSGTATQSQQDQALQAVRQAASDRFDAQVQIKQFEIHELTKRIDQLHLALQDLSEQREAQVQAQVNAAQRNTRPHAKRPAKINQRQNTQSRSQSDD